MPTKQYRPVTPGRRFYTGHGFEELTAKRPEKSLVRGKRERGGRSRSGRVTMRFRGGGAKRRLRQVDLRRTKDGVPGRVAAIEYDPNRSARLALVHYADGAKSYILAAAGMQAGTQVMSGEAADIRPGNTLPLSAIPVGTVVHNIELKAGEGGRLCRSAGSGAQLMAKEGKYATLRLPSSEVRMVYLGCRATVGQVGNVEHENITLGKAGRKRWMGRRPHTRGLAMAPRDHPHGGGEGGSPIGRKHPVSRWGWPTLGHRTRDPNRQSKRLIVSRRRRQKR